MRRSDENVGGYGPNYDDWQNHHTVLSQKELELIQEKNRKKEMQKAKREADEKEKEERKIRDATRRGESFSEWRKRHTDYYWDVYGDRTPSKQVYPEQKEETRDTTALRNAVIKPSNIPEAPDRALFWPSWQHDQAFWTFSLEHQNLEFQVPTELLIAYFHGEENYQWFLNLCAQNLSLVLIDFGKGRSSGALDWLNFQIQEVREIEAKALALKDRMEEAKICVENQKLEVSSDSNSSTDPKPRGWRPKRDPSSKRSQKRAKKNSRG